MSKIIILTLLPLVIADTGIIDLVKRHLPNHTDQFTFSLTDTAPKCVANHSCDAYTVSTVNDTIYIQRNSKSALAVGFVPLPNSKNNEDGNKELMKKVTYSYTTPFWTWQDWSHYLDWAALRGINLLPAWTGYEKLLLDALREVGLDDDAVLPFFAGPAFQAWNRMGNIRGSWGGNISVEWVEGQFALQKRIVERMVELGITPVLPGFQGFVPDAIRRVRGVALVRSDEWGGFQDFTGVYSVDPLDGLFAELQEYIIKKQMEVHGNVTRFYMVDQYNEMNPPADTSYLADVARRTHASLKKGNPGAVWVMQGWLFYNNQDFWEESRVSAYLDGVPGEDMLILDLYSESRPVWRSYFGKSWIWCQLRAFGGNVGLYGQIENVTFGSTQAVRESRSLVGLGLTMEGMEGNEVMYDLLLAQAWSREPLDTRVFFRDWVRSRYVTGLPGVYEAWEVLRGSVYNNTRLEVEAVSRSVFESSPDITGLVGRKGHFPPPTALHYDPVVVVRAWWLLYNATVGELWGDPLFRRDFVDVTRQVLSNAFIPVYCGVVGAWRGGSGFEEGKRKLLGLLSALDRVLACERRFRLDTWVSAARAMGGSEKEKDAFEYEARNQVTLWGPSGEISDYASKPWAGLVGSYYMRRWEIFLDYLGEVDEEGFDRGGVEREVESV
ncbi:tim-barrel domain-containing protein [Aspergillus avenaceus]|uniref:Tim-barrel domain-containing protein n=1 Tax=Aspergillus avenaceus TaxID=36643 RepID=A0A5N6U3X9_ASPAV|nr:tim-barrel domain-containing protein [Aspergillus avenaceus]